MKYISVNHDSFGKTRFASVLFDLDGVIVNSEDAHRRAFLKTFKCNSSRIPAKWYEDYFAGRTDMDGFRAMFPDMPLQAIRNLVKEK